MMDITLLYLQKEICTGIIICFTNNGYTIYIYRDICVYSTDKVLDEGDKVAPCNECTKF